MFSFVYRYYFIIILDCISNTVDIYIRRTSDPKKRPTFKAIHNFFKMDQNVLLGLSDEDPYEPLHSFRSGIDAKTATMLSSSNPENVQTEKDETNARGFSTYISVTDDEEESTLASEQVRLNGNSEESNAASISNSTNLTKDGEGSENLIINLN